MKNKATKSDFYRSKERKRFIKFKYNIEKLLYKISEYCDKYENSLYENKKK